MSQQPPDADHQPMSLYHPPSVYWPVEPEKPRRKRGKSILIGGTLITGLILALLFLLFALFGGQTQISPPPYPWSVTIHSGYERATTLWGVPVGASKHVQLHITLTNTSTGDTLSPQDLTWTLTDANTNEGYAGTLSGIVPVSLSLGSSVDCSLDFSVPIAATVFTLSLSGPAGPDPTTWPVRFSA